MPNIRTFNTLNFRVVAYAHYEKPDYYYKEPSLVDELKEKFKRGELRCFSVIVKAYFRNTLLAQTHLGNCIYETPAAFMDHVGIRRTDPNAGSYFSDLIREVCTEARTTFNAQFADIPKLRNANK